MINEENILNFLKDHQSIFVFVSGGFDSCVLSFFISQHRDFEFCTVPRYDNSIIHAIRIKKWLEEKNAGKQYNINIVGNPNLHHSQQVRSGIDVILRKKPNGTVVLADTKNPPINFNYTGPFREKSNNKRVFQPFFDHHKTDVIELADKLGILKEASEISHTCTESKLLRCNQCWQCQERKWAFEQTKKVDYGKM